MNYFVFTQDWCHGTHPPYGFLGQSSESILPIDQDLPIFRTIPTLSLPQSPGSAVIHQD